MVINPTKLLPPSKGALAVRGKGADSVAKPKKGQTLEGQVLVIRSQVIKIEKLISRGYTLKLKEQKEQEKEKQKEKRGKREQELEEKKPPKEGKGKLPTLPKLGFLDRIKNFIGNMLLAFFAVKLIDHLPKLVPFVTALGNATEFLLDVGGKLLDGLVTFIDWGYKAYDATRGFLKNLGGENFAKVFDGFSSAIGTLVDVAIIAAIALASSGGDDRGGPGGGKPGKGGRTRVTTSGGKPAGRPDIRNPLRQRPTVTTGQGGKSAGPKIKVPKGLKARGGLLGLVFLIPDLIDAGMLVSQGRGKDGLRTLLSAVSGVVAGMGAYAATLAGAAALGITGVGLPAAIGLALAGFAASSVAGAAAYNLADAGLRKMGLVDKDSSGKPYAYKSGGPTRGGKRQGSIRRTGGVSAKKKIRRKLTTAIKPKEIEFESPGADAGGKEKVQGFFGFLKDAVDKVNPFNTVKETGKDLGKTDYFGPILAITSKITLGQKPTSQDYKQVGLGINLLLSKGIQNGKLLGGVAAFAEGGFVDPKTLEAISSGGDISDWVASTFKGAIETNAQRTLRMIRENAGKKEQISKTEQEKEQQSDLDNLDVGPGGTVTGGNADFWTLVAISRMEDSDLQGSADVAQSIYNRVASGIYGGKTIKEIVLRQGQYEPTWKYPQRGKTGVPNPEWHAIKDLASASKATGISQTDLQKTAAALRNSKYQQEAAKFVGGRTDFMGGNNQPGPGDIRRKENTPNNFFGWFVGPAAKAYGAKNPGPAKAPQLGDIVVMGGGTGSLGAGSVSSVDEFTPIAKKYGLTLTSSYRPGDPGYHGKNRARDYSNDSVGKGTPQQLAFAKHLSEKYGSSLSQLIYTPLGYGIANKKRVGLDYWGSGTNAQHYHHVHVAYEKGGETLDYPHLATIGERGKEFVIDADSTEAIQKTFPGFLDAVNKGNYRGSIKALQNFASYEDGAQEEVIVMQNQQSDDQSTYQNPIVISDGGLGGDSYDPFAGLDSLPG